MSNTTKHTSYHDNQGFTLVELLVALAIASFFIGATIMIIDSSANAYRSQERVAEVQQEARAALEIMARDIRMAGLDATINSVGGMEVADATSIRFTQDNNMSGTIDDADEERITYTFTDGTINRILYEGTASQTSAPLISNVENLVMTYRDKEWAVTGTLGDIVVVDITITRQGRDHKNDLFERTFTTRVNIRNLSI